MTVTDPSFSVAGLRAWPLSVPIQTPRRNAFGIQTERSALFIELTLSYGHTGWGESFANWPHFAVQHRARIIEEIIKPLIIGKEFASPSALWDTLDKQLSKISIQSAEPGPFQSAIAGIEISAWNAIADREQCALVDLLGGSKGQPLPYASGLTGATLTETLPILIEAGWRAFKLKVGFGRDKDRKALEMFRQIAGPDVKLMVDANMAWDLECAIGAGNWLSDYDVYWVEEPIPADRPISHWYELTKACPIKIAAGENLRGNEQFDKFVKAGVKVIQPDPVKWGGLTQSMAIGNECKNKQVEFAPHFLGGCIGLEAVRAVAVATGGDFIEVDVTENPLRSMWLVNSILDPDNTVWLDSGFKASLMKPYLVKLD